MDKLEQLQQKLQINEYGLEVELRELPALVDEVGTLYIMAVSERDEAKLALEEIEARVDADIRQSAEVAGEKITNPEVESQKKLDPKVKTANKKYSVLKLEAARWGVLKEALDKKSYALSKLCDLYISNYYSEIEKKGNGDFKTIQSHKVKVDLKERRKRVELEK